MCCIPVLEISPATRIAKTIVTTFNKTTPYLTGFNFELWDGPSVVNDPPHFYDIWLNSSATLVLFDVTNAPTISTPTNSYVAI